jgi:hypothetical protein
MTIDTGCGIGVCGGDSCVDYRGSFRGRPQAEKAEARKSQASQSDEGVALSGSVGPLFHVEIDPLVGRDRAVNVDATGTPGRRANGAWCGDGEMRFGTFAEAYMPSCSCGAYAAWEETFAGDSVIGTVLCSLIRISEMKNRSFRLYSSSIKIK